MPLLHPGDTFPRLTLNTPGAQAIEVPGAIGRLVPEDVTGLVGYLRAHAAASS